MKIYFAGPLFSEAERDWIRSTIDKIESLAAQRGTKIEIIFPYDLITPEEIDLLCPSDFIITHLLTILNLQFRRGRGRCDVCTASQFNGKRSVNPIL
jgi:hypothetical protein